MELTVQKGKCIDWVWQFLYFLRLLKRQRNPSEKKGKRRGGMLSNSTGRVWETEAAISHSRVFESWFRRKKRAVALVRMGGSIFFVHETNKISEISSCMIENNNITSIFDISFRQRNTRVLFSSQYLFDNLSLPARHYQVSSPPPSSVCPASGKERGESYISIWGWRKMRMGSHRKKRRKSGWDKERGIKVFPWERYLPRFQEKYRKLVEIALYIFLSL